MTVPARFSPPPFPCTVESLLDWLNARHAFSIPTGTRLSRVDAERGILGHVQGRYNRAVPTENEGGIPWPSEVWEFVRNEESKKGQMPLLDSVALEGSA
jgi:hypothetical protein